MNIIKIKLDQDKIFECIEKALKNQFIDNLRERTEIIRLDTKIRGYIGETSILFLLQKYGIKASKTNLISADGNSTDIDIYLQKTNTCLEIKTSLIPDKWGNIENCIEKGDIKIIKRTPCIENLKGDYHLQIYFNCLKEKREQYLNNLQLTSEINIKKLYNILKLDKIKCYFIAWIAKEDLIKYIKKLIAEGVSPIWEYGKREFWKCPIKICKDPFLLIKELKHK